MPSVQYKSTPAGRPTSWIPFAGSFAKHMTPASGLHQRFLWMAGAAAGEGSAAERRKKFAQDAAAVAGWDFERIIMCHGDLIEGKDTARKAWIDACARVSVAARRAGLPLNISSPVPRCRRQAEGLGRRVSSMSAWLVASRSRRHPLCHWQCSSQVPFDALSRILPLTTSHVWPCHVFSANEILCVFARFTSARHATAGALCERESSMTCWCAELWAR